MSELNNMMDFGNETDVVNAPNDINSCGTSATSVRVRTPKRIIHFSDGTLEEYSSDDETDNVAEETSASNKQLDVVSSCYSNDIERNQIKISIPIHYKYSICVIYFVFIRRPYQKQLVHFILFYIFIHVQRRLHWGPWLFHTVAYSGHRFLAACDYVGEKLADFLGITSPKYHYEIEHAKRIQEQRIKEQEEEKDVGGWMQSTNETLVTTAKNIKDKNHDQSCITTQQNIQRY